jgi:hypothetical protein
LGIGAEVNGLMRSIKRPVSVLLPLRNPRGWWLVLVGQILFYAQECRLESCLRHHLGRSGPEDAGSVPAAFIIHEEELPWPQSCARLLVPACSALWTVGPCPAGNGQVNLPDQMIDFDDGAPVE